MKLKVKKAEVLEERPTEVGREVEAVHPKPRVTFNLPSKEKSSKVKNFWYKWFLKRKAGKKSGNQTRKFSPKRIGKALREKTTIKSRSRNIPAAPVPTFVADVAGDDFDDDFDDELLIEGQSEVLTRRELQNLSSSLPSRLLCCSWRKTFNSSEHGFSLSTFYGLLKEHADRPAILLIRDMQGNRFGAFVSDAFKVSDKSFGCGETFVFRCSGSGDLEVWRWTGKNSLFVFCSSKSVCVGLDNGKFAIFLDEGLDCGRSQTCRTFDNEPLTPSGDFRVASVEVWNFE